MVDSCGPANDMRRLARAVPGAGAAYRDASHLSEHLRVAARYVAFSALPLMRALLGSRTATALAARGQIVCAALVS